VGVQRKFGCDFGLQYEVRVFTQDVFAFEAGIHRTYISDIERGAPLLITVVDRIAAALGVKAGQLLD
jgi:transcriptional regulator with XRE-family HTH domain